MVESNPAASQDSSGQPHGILKNAHEGPPTKHAHFNEEEIAAYDAQRGQCQPINDPKTPFHEEESDEEMDQAAE